MPQIDKPVALCCVVVLSSFIINCVVIIKAFAHVFLMPKTRDILPPAPLKKVYLNMSLDYIDWMFFLNFSAPKRKPPSSQSQPFLVEGFTVIVALAA